jgi:hypothetical protein
MFTANNTLGASLISQNATNVTVNGAEQLRGGTNSTAAFQVQSSAGNNLLTADTANNQIVLGNDGTPAAVTVRGGAAAGVDASGANVVFQGSDGTGAVDGGSLVFETGQGASGGIRFDSSAEIAPGNTTATSISTNFTTGTQSNRLLMVDTDCASSSMTYDGFALTKLGSATAPSGLASGTYAELWYILSPPTGTHSIVANYISNCNNGVGGHFNNGELGAASYYNVNQATPFGTFATASGTQNGSGSTNLTLTTISASQIVVDAFGDDDNNFLDICNTPNASQTIRWHSSSQFQKIECGSDLPGIVGQVHVNYTISSKDWVDIGVPVNAAMPGSVPLVSPSSPIPDPMADRLHITADGNIGIDNPNPQATLDVSGTQLIQPSIDTHTAFQIQDASGTAILAADTLTSTISVSGTDSKFATLELTDAHLGSAQTTPPTTGAPSNCGAGTTSSITSGSTDTAGSLTINVGSGLPTTCDTTVTFNKPYGSAAKSITLTPTKMVGGATAPIAAWISNISPTSFTIQIAPTNATAGAIYSYYYIVVQ